jgi:hypothetical protein
MAAWKSSQRKRVKLFVLNEISSKRLHSWALKNLGDEGYSAIYARFREGMWSLGMRIRYCSATEQYCDLSALGPDPC